MSKTAPQAGQPYRFPSGKTRKEIGELTTNEPLDFKLDLDGKRIPEGIVMRLWSRAGVVVQRDLDFERDGTFTIKLSEFEKQKIEDHDVHLYDVYAIDGDNTLPIAKGAVKHVKD